MKTNTFAINMNFKFRHIVIAIVVFASVYFFSCNKKINPITKGKFSFSTDTLTFDTVFTQVGSVTKQFLIYNEENKWLRIKNIALGRGQILLLG